MSGAPIDDITQRLRDIKAKQSSGTVTRDESNPFADNIGEEKKKPWWHRLLALLIPGS